MSVYSNPTVQSTFNQLNGNSFGHLMGFGIYSSSNTIFYYAMDFNDGKVYILNDEWKFISSKSFTNPYNMISIGNSLYMTGWGKIWKVDKDLNIVVFLAMKE